MGIQCCDLIRRFLVQYPFIKPLILTLKKFLSQRDLNSPYHGGLSSYGLILMLVAFLNSDPLNLLEGDLMWTDISLGLLL